MSRDRRRIALLKVLAAAAWADGRVETEEVNHIKELALDAGLDPHALREVHQLLETPIPADRCEVLVRELLEELGSDAERLEVVEEIERLFLADEQLDDRERDLLESVRGALASQSAVDGFLGRITDVFKGAFAKGGGSAGGLTRHLSNAVLQRLDLLTDGAWKKSMDEDTLNRVCLFAAVLGKVADTEDGKSEEEMGRIRSVLGDEFGLAPTLLDALLTAVQDAASADMDRQKLLSEFNRISEMPERIGLLRAAFSVAAADGMVSEAEATELRLIANYLWLDPRDFHAVRASFKRS